MVQFRMLAREELTIQLLSQVSLVCKPVRLTRRPKQLVQVQQEDAEIKHTAWAVLTAKPRGQIIAMWRGGNRQTTMGL